MNAVDSDLDEIGHAVRHLVRLYETALDQGLTVPLVGDIGGPSRIGAIKWVPLDDEGICQLAGAAIERPQHELWVPACPIAQRPARGRGGAADTAGLVALWADLDIAGPGHHPPDGAALPPDEAAALAIIRRLPEPSMIVRTGGGLHAWWLLDRFHRFDTAEDRANAAEISRRWHAAIVNEGAELGYHVDAVGDLARIMRLAGTNNHKSTPTRRVRIIHGGTVDEPTRYRLGDLDEIAVQLAPQPAPPRPKVATATPQTRSACGAAGGPTEWFASTAWAEILEPAGFMLVGHDHAGRELWRRPGSESGSHSLAADPDGAAVVFSSVLAAEWRLGVNKGVSKAFAFAALHYRGDMATMGRELREAARRHRLAAS